MNVNIGQAVISVLLTLLIGTVSFVGKMMHSEVRGQAKDLKTLRNEVTEIKTTVQSIPYEYWRDKFDSIGKTLTEVKTKLDAHIDSHHPQ